MWQYDDAKTLDLNEIFIMCKPALGTALFSGPLNVKSPLP